MYVGITINACMMEGNDKRQRNEVYSQAVRAGRRTYFFDVKETRKGDFYLTITESKKVFDRDNKFHFEKHKLFLYKEDFDKYKDALDDTVSYIREKLAEKGMSTGEEGPQIHKEESSDEVASSDETTPPENTETETEEKEQVENSSDDFTDVDFEDLDKKE